MNNVKKIIYGLSTGIASIGTAWVLKNQYDLYMIRNHSNKIIRKNHKKKIVKSLGDLSDSELNQVYDFVEYGHKFY